MKIDNKLISVNKKMKIIDCFVLYNELDMLEYRLNLLNDLVDNFVIVEATHTFTGEEKPLYYQRNQPRYAKFKDKIIHVVVDDMPNTGSPWQNELHQRNQIHQGVESLNLHPDDLLIITDLDEIPDPRVIQEKKNTNIRINHLPMDLYWYNCNWRHESFVWNPPKILCYAKYTQYECVQHIRKARVGPLSEKCGWHLSYFGDAEFIHNKLNSFSHQEPNVQRINNIQEIERRMKSGLDLYNKERGMNFTYIPINENQYLPLNYSSLHTIIG